MASLDDFHNLDIRVGLVIDVKPFPEARKPSWKIVVDFGQDIGIRQSSAQLKDNYSREQLLNRKVLAVVNLPPRQIGPFRSEVLILGVPDEHSNTVLVIPERDVPKGGKLY